MLRKMITLILLMAIVPTQANAQSKKNFEDINKIWYKFYQAFDSLDYALMAEIHSSQLVRVSGGTRIVDYDNYIANYRRSFEEAKDNNWTSAISLRFFERINNDSVASERGIYKLIRNKNQEDEKAYYGQFHVIFRKELGKWRIIMDYDSNYENSIGEKDYMASHGINEYQYFIE